MPVLPLLFFQICMHRNPPNLLGKSEPVRCLSRKKAASVAGGRLVFLEYRDSTARFRRLRGFGGLGLRGLRRWRWIKVFRIQRLKLET